MVVSKIKRITVVNDHPEFLDLMVDFLSEEGYTVTTIAKHQGAFQQIKETRPDLVICDLVFENMPAGWALLDMLHLDPETTHIPLVLCSAATKQVQEIAPSLSAKGIAWLEKPFRLDDLLTLIETTAQRPS
jgi:CheY-like chemotaxis protein